MRNALLNERRVKREVEEEVNCTWTIQVGKPKTNRIRQLKLTTVLLSLKHKHKTETKNHSYTEFFLSL